jgi:serine/threonine protein kinase/CheY-like chemotaxis protein
MTEQQKAPAPDPLGRILVVDDNDDNSNVLSRRLKRQGYEVITAADGKSALEACDREHFDAVILDVMMPGMSGLEVLETLRKTRSATELLIIMATAKTDSVDVVDALKRGANDYVTKPIDFPILLARLEAQLGMKKEADKRSASVIDVTFGIEPGTVLDGRYEILDKQGEGGFAVVYRATQLSTQQEVAFKHARPDVMRADDGGVHLARFKREVTLIGQLNHSNIVRLIDSGSIPVQRSATKALLGPPTTKPEGQAKDANDASSRTRRRPSTDDENAIEVPYIVMEFLRGESLADLIAREGSLEPSRAVDLVLPVISALGAAHTQGVIHRDVKPGNIMLAETPEGLEPKVLDFGIAKLNEPDKRALTVSSSLIGTPQYMSPEQARGRKDLDGRADQFAIASVLYEMLSGRGLYRGDSFLELVAKVLSAEFTPLSDLRSDLPSGLADIVKKALSANRDDRYESMKMLGQALLPFASSNAALRWAEPLGLDEAARAALVHAPALRPRSSAPAGSQVQIKIADEASNPNDATVQVSIKGIVTIDDATANALGVGALSQAPATQASRKEPEPPEQEQPDPALAETLPSVKPVEAKAAPIERAETKLPWVWIAIGLAVVGVIVRSCL